MPGPLAAVHLDAAALVVRRALLERADDADAATLGPDLHRPGVAVEVAVEALGDGLLRGLVLLVVPAEQHGDVGGGPLGPDDGAVLPAAGVVVEIGIAADLRVMLDRVE